MNNEVLSGFASDNKPAVGKPVVKETQLVFSRPLDMEKTNDILKGIIQKYATAGPRITGHGERAVSDSVTRQDRYAQDPPATGKPLTDNKPFVQGSEDEGCICS